jgi:hypothetical protein
MVIQIDRLNYNASHAIEAPVRTATPTNATIDRPLRFVNSRDRHLSPSPKLEFTTPKGATAMVRFVPRYTEKSGLSPSAIVG